MSSAAGIIEAGRLQRARNDLAHAAARVRLIKLLCGALLVVCFWYSVPYLFPFIAQHFPEKAATAEAFASEGSASRQVAVPVIGLIGAFLYWRLPHRGRMTGYLKPFLIAYVSWAFLSIAWSVDPRLTLKRLVVFGIDAFFAYVLARTFSVLEMSLLGVTATTVVAALGFYCDFFMLKVFAPGDPEYRFEGVTEANYQAMSLVACLLCSLTLLDRKPKWAKWLIPMMTVDLALLYLTRSRVSTIICLLLMSIMIARLARRHMQPHTRAMLAVGALMVVLPALVYFVGRKGMDAAQTAFMMGRNDTQNTSNLSNRGPLWQELSESVRERPLQGFGYAAFWTPDRVFLISGHQGWAVPHAHESYLDQTLALGVVGGLLYIICMWGGALIAWGRYRRTRSGPDLLAAALITWIVLEGFAESAPLDPYLPSMLAYACLVKMCMAEGSERESDVWLGDGEVIGGLSPESLRRLPEPARHEATQLLGGLR